MFSQKTWTNNKPEESNSQAVVRQDSRTTVKTATAQSETKNTSVQNATIVSANTLTYQTTRQTVTHQQTARITEIHTCRTPTEEELNELLANFNTSKACNAPQSTKATPSSSVLKPTNNNAIGKNILSYEALTNNNGKGNKTNFNFKSSTKPSVPTNFGKIQQTTVTQSDGRKVTSHCEEQNIKLNAKSFDFKNAAKTAAQTNLYADSSKYNLGATSMKTTTATTRPVATATVSTTRNLIPATTYPNTSYVSPYKNRALNYNNTGNISNNYNSNLFQVDARPGANPSTTQANAKTTPSQLGYSTVNAFSREFSNKETPKVASSYASAINTKTKSNLRPAKVYVINNVKFDNKDYEERTGTNQDVEALKKVLQKYKTTLELKTDATLKDIKKLANTITEKNFVAYSAVVVVILTHGTRNENLAAKDGVYSLDDDLVFPILQNKTLTNKPKIFVVQACKGSREIGKFAKDAATPVAAPSEVLKCYSTFEGYAAYRTEDGSLFIQTFCELLHSQGMASDIERIMQNVRLAVKERSRNMQVPSVTTTLTEPYVFGDYV